MDFLCVGAWVVVMFKDETCGKPLHAWYTVNGLIGTASLVFTIWYTYKELKLNYQTKRTITVTYVFEATYLLMSVWAWIILSSTKNSEEC